MRCSSSRGRSVCLAGGQLRVGLDDTLGFLVADRVGLQMRMRIQNDKQSSQSVQSMQAGYVSRRRIQVRSRGTRNDGHEAQCPGLLDQTGD